MSAGSWSRMLGSCLSRAGTTSSAEDGDGGGRDVQAADPAQIRLHELDGVLPHRRRVIHDGVEPAEDRIRLAVRRRPALAQPLLLDGADAEDVAHLGHLEVHVGEPLRALEDGLRDVVRVAELVVPHRDRTRKQLDGLGDAVALVGEMAIGGHLREWRASARPAPRAARDRARSARAWRVAGP